jgi:hypothetical protein
LCVAFCGLIFPATLWAEEPPTDCQGTETFQFEVQASLDGGATWTSDSVTLCLLPGRSVDIAVRTLMTVTAGETQGWSFSLKQNAIWSQYYGGGISVTGVTIEGTDTETVQDGGLPDVNSLILSPDGYTQGVLIDTNTGLSLPPVTSFVTSRACYHLTAPSYYGTYLTTLKFTHDLGNPPIRSVITQDGRSNLPCARNLNLYVKLGGCYSQSYPGCTLPGRRTVGLHGCGRGSHDRQRAPAGRSAGFDGLLPAMGQGDRGGLPPRGCGPQAGPAVPLGFGPVPLDVAAPTSTPETLGSLLRRGTREFTG